jgi:hypothetical protein
VRNRSHAEGWRDPTAKTVTNQVAAPQGGY